CHGAESRALFTLERGSPATGGFMKALLYLGPAAILCIVFTALPLLVAILFAARPSSLRLALMRPLSLAAIFAALAGLCLGLAISLVGINRHALDANLAGYAAQVFAESVIPTFVSFALLTAAWLVVAVGMRRQAAGGAEG